MQRTVPMTDWSFHPRGSWMSRGVALGICLVAGLAGAHPVVAGERNDAPPAASPEQSPPSVERPGDWQTAFPLLNETDEPEYWRKNLFKRFFSDQKYLVTTWWPAELRHPGFLIPMLGTTAVAISDQGVGSVDYRLGGSVREWGGGLGRSASRAITTLGDGSFDLVFVGGTWLLAHWAGNDRLARASSLSAEGLLSSALWVGALKTLTERTRPSGGGDGSFFTDRTSPGQQADSFPSGHTMGAFTVATVFAHEYSDKRWVPWVAYGAAGLVGASRVTLGRHFPSDVMVGALLGNSIGRMVIARQGEGGERTVQHLQPLFDPASGAYGMSYSRSW